MHFKLLLRYILKNPEWAVYQEDIGKAAQNLANLFNCEKQDEQVTVSISRYDIHARLHRAIERHGAVGVWKIFWQRVFKKNQ